MKTKTDELHARRSELLRKASSIVDAATAASRDLTTTEHAECKSATDELRRIDTELAAIALKAAKSSDLVTRLTGGGGAERPDDAPPEALNGSYGKGRQAWAKSVATTLRAGADGVGVKALLTGEVTTPAAVGVVALPNVPTRLLDLIPREGLNEQHYSYLRQTVRTNNAAVVADNALKPTSVYTFEEVEARARVIAHLSEPFPIRYAQDHASMVQVLDGQMLNGIEQEIEAQVVSGTGTGEDFTGILTTSGTTAVAFATDVLTTLRKARTALEGKGERVTGVVMNPADIEALDLLREDGSTGGFLVTADVYERVFGPGVRGIPSLAVPQGTAILGDWSTTRLRVREGAHTLAATQAGDLFDKNQMKLRSEGRYNLDLLRPQALAVADLTAA